MEAQLSWLLLAAILAGVIAGAVLWILSVISSRAGARPAADPGPGACVFHLRDGVLVDHDAPDSTPLDGFHNWHDLHAWLAPRFRDLPADLPPPGQDGPRSYRAVEPSDKACLTIKPAPGGHRICLVDPQAANPAGQHDRQVALAQIGGYREAVEAAPCAICAISPDGAVLWRNAAFRAFSDAETDRLLHAAQDRDDRAIRRLDLPGKDDGRPRHVRLTVTEVDGAHVLFAEDATDLVRADAMRGSFVQTLTKTFADLAIGLAVFDRDQRLVLFNPAMLDLTGLPAEFLSARPSLLEFFDRLRDRRILPEPKNYATWRAQINEMIEGAADGRYSDTWALPSGLTYRVTGRPHPDGAIAFLIEDVTDEVSLSRRSRTQLEIRQAVLDRLDEAVAVTGPNGLVLFCNRACRDLLAIDPDSSFAETSLSDLLSACRRHLPDDAFWSEVAASGARTRAEVVLPSRTGPTRVRVEPLAGGFSMISLTAAEQRQSVSA